MKATSSLDCDQVQISKRPTLLHHKLVQYRKLSLRLSRIPKTSHKYASGIRRLRRYERHLYLAGLIGGLTLTMPSQAQLSAQGCATTGTEFLVNTETSNSQGLPAIAMDSDGDFVITWQSFGQDGNLDGIYAQRYSADGVALGGEFQVNNHTTSSQTHPAIAMDSDGDFIITWQSLSQDGDSYGIYARRYDNNGVAQGSEFRINNHTTSAQREPAIAVDSNGDFVITWGSSGQDGDNYGIYARRYSAAGFALGNEFQVNTHTTSSQRNPEIAMDSDGDFVITWQSYDQVGDEDAYGVYAQRYNGAGVAQGSEFQVNTYTTGSQNNPSIAMDSDGDFVITWQSYNQDGSGWGVYAQRYNGAGVTQGSEFQVNTETYSYQRGPSIAMDSDGDFAITWYSFGQDGSDYGVYAQRYNAAGAPRGSEFQVNTETNAAQALPSIAMDSDGDIVVTWQSFSQDGSSDGVYAQRYSCNAAPIPTLGTWGLYVLSLLLLIVGVVGFKSSVEQVQVEEV